MNPRNIVASYLIFQAIGTMVWWGLLYCIGVSILTDESWIASALMATMAGLSLAMATIHGTAVQTPAIIRATKMNRTTAVLWTFAQTSVFWIVFLWILPQGIVELESRAGSTALHHPGQGVLSITLFIFASVLGLWSGVAMAIHGEGTPLPTATAPKLVIAGPYRFVRNPMALAGILQGVAVGWYFGSVGVVSYAVAGAFVWQWFVRPVEENDLQQRFGDSYRKYQDEVSLWVPTFFSCSLVEVDS